MTHPAGPAGGSPDHDYRCDPQGTRTGALQSNSAMIKRYAHVTAIRHRAIRDKLSVGDRRTVNGARTGHGNNAEHPFVRFSGDHAANRNRAQIGSGRASGRRGRNRV